MMRDVKYLFLLIFFSSLFGCAIGPEKRDPPAVFDLGPPRTYTAAAPLSYTDLAAEQKESQTQFAGKPSPYTGFRVVLPLP